MVRVSSELTVPDGVGEGDVLHVRIDGLSLDVTVPAGVASGETFVFEYERPDDAVPPPAPETWPPPESSWPSGDSLLMAAVRSRRLTPDNAQALTDIMDDDEDRRDELGHRLLRRAEEEEELLLGERRHLPRPREHHGRARGVAEDLHHKKFGWRRPPRRTCLVP